MPRSGPERKFRRYTYRCWLAGCPGVARAAWTSRRMGGGL